MKICDKSLNEDLNIFEKKCYLSAAGKADVN